MIKPKFKFWRKKSWKYFTWGLFNGFVLGMGVLYGINLSRGAFELILRVLRKLFLYFHLPGIGLALMIYIFTFIGAISAIVELYEIIKKGWGARTIAFCGLMSTIFLLLSYYALAGIFFLIGVILIYFSR